LSIKDDDKEEDDEEEDEEEDENTNEEDREELELFFLSGPCLGYGYSPGNWAT
jgi:hypothetical protein